MRILLAFLFAIIGLVVGAVGTAAAVLVAGNLVGASDFEGALSMQAIFAAGPLGGLAGMILGIWLALRRPRAA